MWLPMLRNNRFQLILLILWIVCIFPGRAQTDDVTQLSLMRNHQSSGTWTGIYFRFLQIISFNGKSLFCASLVEGFIFLFALYIFINRFVGNQFNRKIIIYVFLLTPVVPFFAFTINHQNLFTSGVLIFMARYDEISRWQNSSFYYLCTAAILTSCTQMGLIFGVFISLIFFIKSKIIRGIAVLVLFSSVFIISNIGLGVPTISPALRLAPIFGDIKCVVQNPIAKISKDDWRYLESLGEKSRWQRIESCSVADNGFFSLDKVSTDGGKQLIQVWIDIAKENPLLVLNAHFQRSRVVLPPLVGEAPVHTYPSELQDIGELKQIGPALLAVAPSSNFQAPKNHLFSILSGFVELYAITFNFKTFFLGWGGLWLTISVLITLIRKSNLKLAHFFPVIGIHLFLFMWCPNSDSRYIMFSCFIGYVVFLDFLLSLKPNSNKSEYLI